uniref:G_PROTEIN_RECEP_F1_2 domain-containing protein n=1 Tax=Heterorhabditis bacteriophora TaxID=37862 RepID=A0A1I7WLA8_HETBA
MLPNIIYWCEVFPIYWIFSLVWNVLTALVISRDNCFNVLLPYGHLMCVFQTNKDRRRPGIAQQLSRERRHANGLRAWEMNQYNNVTVPYGPMNQCPDIFASAQVVSSMIDGAPGFPSLLQTPTNLRLFVKGQLPLLITSFRRLRIEKEDFQDGLRG